MYLRHVLASWLCWSKNVDDAGLLVDGAFSRVCLTLRSDVREGCKFAEAASALGVSA